MYHLVLSATSVTALMLDTFSPTVRKASSAMTGFHWANAGSSVSVMVNEEMAMPLLGVLCWNEVLAVESPETVSVVVPLVANDVAVPPAAGVNV